MLYMFLAMCIKIHIYYTLIHTDIPNQMWGDKLYIEVYVLVLGFI